jgi:hypothetical protein
MTLPSKYELNYYEYYGFVSQNPSLQPHKSSELVPAAEVELYGHLSQVEMSTAAEFPENVPAVQFVHICDPFACLYEPAKHGLHVPPSCPVYPALHRHLSL